MIMTLKAKILTMNPIIITLYLISMTLNLKTFYWAFIFIFIFLWLKGSSCHSLMHHFWQCIFLLCSFCSVKNVTSTSDTRVSSGFISDRNTAPLQTPRLSTAGLPATWSPARWTPPELAAGHRLRTKLKKQTEQTLKCNICLFFFFRAYTRCTYPRVRDASLRFYFECPNNRMYVLNVNLSGYFSVLQIPRQNVSPLSHSIRESLLHFGFRWGMNLPSNWSDAVMMPIWTFLSYSSLCK